MGAEQFIWDDDDQSEVVLFEASLMNPTRLLLLAASLCGIFVESAEADTFWEWGQFF